MNALKNKWRSRRGASVVLALLFLLVCMMVGSSVLMAAASNAGKIKSNREEQQKYLTLSSALELVGGKLETMRYTGRYRYESDETISPNPEETADGEGRITAITNYCVFTRTDGETNDEWNLEDVLPLRNYLDYVVSELFAAREAGSDKQTSYTSDIDDIEVTTSYVHRWDGAWPGATEPPTKYTMFLTVEPPGGIEGGIADTVEMTVEILDDLKLDLTATLVDGDGTSYRMYARLDPVNLLRAPEPGYGVYGPGTAGTMSWELKYISKSRTEDTI